MAINTVPPHLPDLVIHRIIRLLPTIAAVRMSFLSKQWEGVLSSVPILDFDEGDENDNNLVRHRKFVDNILKRYLELCKKEKQKQLLDKFRLCMTRYLSADATVVNKWLRYSMERSVKELDISLRVDKSYWLWGGLRSYYCLSRNALANANSITTLNLEYMRIKNISRYGSSTDKPIRLLPSLKAMSLKNVHFDTNALLYLTGECPSMESLSLTSCSFANFEICVSNSSLRSFGVKQCKASEIRVYEAVNLESLTVVSSSFELESMIFRECYNLKYMNIFARHLKVFQLDGCYDVKATINAPKLCDFNFEGYLKSEFSLKAPKLWSASILLWDNWDGEFLNFDGPWKHLPRLRDFLGEFKATKGMTLLVSHFKALIFPKEFRETFSSSSPKLLNLKVLDLAMENAPTNMRDKKDLTNSLLWMAPTLQEINQLEYNEELEMYV
ncbi:putative F-box/LRR-repeat protein [Rosa sericea]